jgi:multicomponent Na+:H+ antiporter subunit D
VTALALALVIPWTAGTVLVALDGRARIVGWLAVGALAAQIGALVALAVDVLPGRAVHFVTGGWPADVGINLRADSLGMAFALVSAVMLLAAVVQSVLEGIQERTFAGLVVLLATGLNGLFLTGDIFNFYVFFEIAMTAAYVLTTYGGGRRELGAALVFAAVNLLGSSVFLLAISGVYRVTGTLAMESIALRMRTVEPNAAILIAVGFFIAFGVKLGLFPFHFWLPTVYTGARPVVAAILSGSLANIGAYGLIRFGAGLLPNELELGATALILIGCASIVYGGLLAISRRDPAETLAYSSIGQVGYVLVALGIGGPVGLAAAVLYALVNSLNKTMLFLAVGVRGALISAVVVLGSLSVAGMPPAAGFLGKLALVHTGIIARSPALVALLVAGSALSFVYMFQMYQREFWSRPRARHASPWPLQLLPAILALLVLAAGLWPEPLLALSRGAAAVLSGGDDR